MVFDKDALRSIRDEMTAALRPIELAHGISLKMGSMTFDAERFTCRIEALVAGSQDDVARKEWGRYCIFYGLKAEDFGKTVRVNGMSGTIYGLKSRAQKYPILVKAPNGKTYKVSAEDVAMRLSAAS
jgi:hypothetical protein